MGGLVGLACPQLGWLPYFVWRLLAWWVGLSQGSWLLYPRRPQAPPSPTPPAKEALEWGQAAPEASEQKPEHSSLTLEEGW